MTSEIDIAEMNVERCWHAQEIARRQVNADPTGENVEHYFKLRQQYIDAKQSLNEAIDKSYA